MKYVSTRGLAPKLGFNDVLLAGLARDGGLYVPEAWPRFSKSDIRGLRGLAYAEIAAQMALQIRCSLDISIGRTQQSPVQLL